MSCNDRLAYLSMLLTHCVCVESRSRRRNLAKYAGVICAYEANSNIRIPHRKNERYNMSLIQSFIVLSLNVAI